MDADTLEYHRKYNLARYHARREEFKALLGGKCVVCGTTEELEFDHIHAENKSFNVGKLLNVSKAKALGELKKCQLLCKTHHLEKTIREGDLKPVEHGGGVSGKRNCKCDLCRDKKNAYMREYKKSRQ